MTERFYRCNRNKISNNTFYMRHTKLWEANINRERKRRNSGHYIHRDTYTGNLTRKSEKKKCFKRGSIYIKLIPWFKKSKWLLSVDCILAVNLCIVSSVKWGLFYFFAVTQRRIATPPALSLSSRYVNFIYEQRGQPTTCCSLWWLGRKSVVFGTLIYKCEFIRI